MFNPQLTQLVMFDLDGTLVDTVPDIALALDQAMALMQYSVPGERRVRQWVGNGSRLLLRRALADHFSCSEQEVDEALLEQSHQHFLERYALCCRRRSQLYKGVSETLAFLHSTDVKMVCITNKPAKFTPAVLAHCQIDHYFAMVLSGDSLPEKKPHPAPLEYAMEHYHVAPSRSLMVGDSMTDIRAARAAKVPILAVNYGYNHGRTLTLPSEPTGSVDEPDWLVGDMRSFFTG